MNNQIAKTRQQDEHTPWAVTDLPPQTGKLAVVTGANSGIRWHTLRELARAGSEVIVAARSEAKGRDAVERVRRELPSAQVHFETLDLADLPSMRAFADTGGKGCPHSVGGFEETHGHCFRGSFS